MAKTQRAQKTQHASSQSSKKVVSDKSKMGHDKTKKSTKPEIDISTPKKSSEVSAQSRGQSRATPSRAQSSRSMSSRTTARSHSTTKRAR